MTVSDALRAAWEAESTRRQSEAAIGTLGRSRLWHRLDGDARSYYQLPKAQGCFFIKLNTFAVETHEGCTEGQMVACYVTTMLPELTPSDWWWRKMKDGRIEVCIRSTKVDEIERVAKL